MLKPWILRQLDTFIHIQTIPMNEVTIIHNKSKLCPKVTLLNSEGNSFKVLITPIDKNTILIQMNRAIEFTAYIN